MNHFAKTIAKAIPEEDLLQSLPEKNFGKDWLKKLQDQLYQRFPHRLKFDVDRSYSNLRRFMTGEYDDEGNLVFFSPEKILELCTKILTFQDEAWKNKVYSEEEKIENAFVTNLIVQVMKYSHPHISPSEISETAKHYIDYLRRENPKLDGEMFDKTHKYVAPLEKSGKWFEDSETNIRVFADNIAKFLTREDFNGEPDKSEEVVDELFEEEFSHLLLYEIALSNCAFGAAVYYAHNEGKSYSLQMGREKFKKQMSNLLKLQEEAWSKRVIPEEEKSEDLLVADLVHKSVKFSHPWIPETEIPTMARKYIAYLRKNYQIPKGRLFDRARYHVITHFEARREDYP